MSSNSAWGKPLQINETLSKKPVNSESKHVVKPPVEMSLSDLISVNSSSSTTGNSSENQSTTTGFLNYSKYEEGDESTTLSFSNERILVLDAGAFINYMKIEKHGSKFFTTPQVLNEIKDSRSRHILYTLPFDIHVREPTEDDIKTVSTYAKKTGDYANLSATDIGVIALTLMIEKEMNGTKNLKPEPPTLSIASGIKCSTPLPYSELRNKMEGKERSLSTPQEPASEGEAQAATKEEFNEEEVDSEESQDDDDNEGEWITPENIKEYRERTNNLNKDTSWSSNSVNHDNHDDTSNEQDTTTNHHQEETVSESQPSSDSASTFEETSTNPSEKFGGIKYVGKLFSTEKGVEHKVGCMTSDFSVQHVLAHMGLNLVSVDGFKIKYLSQWVKRCTCCFTIVPDVERKYCPNCGHDTLRRITCVMDEDGTLNFYYNPKAKISLRGTIYTNPIPKGGKFNNDPVYREDQLYGYNKNNNSNKKSNKILNAKPTDDFDLYSKSGFSKRRNPKQNVRRRK
ncbi:hypothetical protein C9374_004867 [Naegleria lovaniensis]|uniref:20S-pre-rRNA D-site endonuclease NOB1 n=1 Tax=Naegleria lovaniensis TaxID=51637 RepID=A0AA88GMA7_NAELO|nr:uncharacterized protein C9374_004867 [Naegleria lovaniensis]KAG2382900.1 hypothetical protein C9374_004867 [Naegleria lovaniensis]